MTRAPFQVLVFPYRRRDDRVEYAIVKRADTGDWQAISGGGEDDETPRAAAAREMLEEAGLTNADLLIQLDAIGMVSVEHFRDRPSWDPSLREVPEHAFGVAVGQADIALSDEHAAVAWLAIDDAILRLAWESNRIALRELHQRLAKSFSGGR